jgi:glyoxylase-like metal-dependent hydrolase (beta-lactamase superfamily II)
VDTGKNGHGSRLKAAMTRAGVSQLDHLVITHYHENHYGGADDLVNAPGAVQVVEVYDRVDKTFLPPESSCETTQRQPSTSPDGCCATARDECGPSHRSVRWQRVALRPFGATAWR